MALVQNYVPVGSFFDTNRTAVEEKLNRAIQITASELDPVFRRFNIASDSMASADAIGRDMLIHKNLMSRMNTGVIEAGDPYGDFSLYGEARQIAYGPKAVRQASPVQNYPDPFDGIQPKPYRFSIPLRSEVANIPMTLDMLRANALNATTIDLVNELMLGFAQNWSTRFCASFYANQNDQYRYGTLGGTSNYTISTTDRTIVFTPPEGNIDRYVLGTRVDIFSSVTNRVNQTGGVRIRAVISLVDPTANKVTIALEQDRSILSDVSFAALFTTGTIGSSAFVVPANSYNSTGGVNRFTGIAGVNSYLKFANGTSPTDAQKYLLGAEAVNNSTLGGAIDVTQHPEWKSHYWDIGGVAMTEHKMQKILDNWERVKGPIKHTVDTWITTVGVLRAWQATRQAQFRLDRTNATDSMSSQGGGDTVKFEHNGKTMEALTSNWINQGEGYFLKLGGKNFKTYVPPRAGGTKGGGSEVPSFVPFEFVGPFLTGTDSIKLPYRSANGRITNGVEMPGDLRMQIVPDQPDGIKIVNQLEDKDYSDATN